jgi:exosortase A
VGLGILVLIFLVAFWPSIAWMAGEWSSSAGALSHGYLVVAISAYLFVRAVPQVATLDVKPAWWLLPIVFGLSVTWLLAYVATVVAVQTMVLPAMLLFSIIAVLGLQTGRLFAFPVLYVYFAIPAWDHLQFVFQAITVAVVGAMIRMSDMPALLDGNFVHLADGTFEIAGGCSGLAFVLAGLSLAVLYAHLYYKDHRKAFVLVAVTLAVAMASNWVRVFAIISIGHRSHMQSSLVDDHLTFGWVLFAMLLVPLYLFARWLEGEHETVHEADQNYAFADESRRVAPALAAAIAVMVAGPGWAATVSAPESGEIILELPSGKNGWVGPAESHWNWNPTYIGSDAEILAQYVAGEDVVLVYKNLYRVQRQDKELVYFASKIEGDWRAGRDVAVNPAHAVGEGLSFRQEVASNYAGDWLIWYRYQVGEQLEVSDFEAKFAQAFETLKGRPEAGVIAFAARCIDTCEHATDTLARFALDIGAEIRILDNRRDD